MTLSVSWLYAVQLLDDADVELDPVITTTPPATEASKKKGKRKKKKREQRSAFYSHDFTSLLYSPWPLAHGSFLPSSSSSRS